MLGRRAVRSAHRSMARWDRYPIVNTDEVLVGAVKSARQRRRAVRSKLRRLVVETAVQVVGAAVALFGLFYLVVMFRNPGTIEIQSPTDVLDWARDLRGGWTESTLLVAPLGAFLPATLTLIFTHRGVTTRDRDVSPDAQAAVEMLQVLLRVLLNASIVLALMALLPPNSGLTVSEAVLAAALAVSSSAMSRLLHVDGTQYELQFLLAKEEAETAQRRIKVLRPLVEASWGTWIVRSPVAAGSAVALQALGVTSLSSFLLLLPAGWPSVITTLAVAVAVSAVLGVPLMFGRAAWTHARGSDRVIPGYLLVSFSVVNVILVLSATTEPGIDPVERVSLVVGLLAIPALSLWLPTRSRFGPILDYAASVRTAESARRRIQYLRDGIARAEALDLPAASPSPAGCRRCSSGARIDCDVTYS